MTGEFVLVESHEAGELPDDVHTNLEGGVDQTQPIWIWCSLFCCSYGLMSEAINLVDGRQTVRNHSAMDLWSKNT